MRNNRLLPYETIIKATSGEPEAVNAVLQHYRGLICYYSLVNGRIDRDAIVAQLSRQKSKIFIMN